MPKISFKDLLFNKVWPWKDFKEKREKRLEAYYEKLWEKYFKDESIDVESKSDIEMEEKERKLKPITEDTEEEIKDTLTKDNFENENLTNEKINLNTTTQKTEEEIEKILYENVFDKLKVFLRRYFLENIGKEPKLSVEKDYVNISLLQVKLDKSINEIIFDKLKKWEYKVDTKSYYSTSIVSEVLRIEFSPRYFEFRLYPLSKDTTKVLRQVKYFFDDFISYMENFNEYNFDENKVSDLLNLEPEDKLIMTDEELTVSFTIDKDKQLDFAELTLLVANLFTKVNDYYFKIDSTWSGFKLEILKTKNEYPIIVYVSKKWKEISISLSISKYRGVTRSFFQNVIKNLLIYLKEYFRQDLSYVKILEKYGVMVKESNFSWTIEQLYEQEWFVWYEDIKQQIITHIVKPWKNKEEYKKFVEEKLPNLKNIIPNATLFYGAPWTGKTTMASIIWQYLGYPFVYIPVNKIMSKYFWESENILSSILELSGKLAKEKWGAVLMIDEIDEIWQNRDTTSSDASNRILWVLLRKLDGIEKIDNILLIWSTNRNDSLDSALLSRFSQQVEFRLPNKTEIKHILKYYLGNLLNDEDKLNYITQKLIWKSWRDIKKIAEDFGRYVVFKEISWNYEQHFIEFLKLN